MENVDLPTNRNVNLDQEMPLVSREVLVALLYFSSSILVQQHKRNRKKYLLSLMNDRHK